MSPVATPSEMSSSGGTTGRVPFKDNNFGKKLLEKMGWKSGEGLGKNGTGIKQYVHVSKKDDNLGIGAEKTGSSLKEGWWDSLFNKTAVRIGPVDSDDESSSSSSSSDSSQSAASATSPGSKMSKRGKKKGKKRRMSTESSMSDSSAEHAKYKTKLSDAELLAACGGRTCKGRFNTQDGKLARLAAHDSGKWNGLAGMSNPAARRKSVDTPSKHTDGSGEGSQKKSKKGKDSSKKKDKSSKKSQKDDANGKESKKDKKKKKKEKKEKKDKKKEKKEKKKDKKKDKQAKRALEMDPESSGDARKKRSRKA